MHSPVEQITNASKQQTWLFRAALLVLGICLCFWRLGDAEVLQWDESYYGILAAEMLETNDFINYHVGGEIEQWVGKPPLVVWAIAGSYQIWGRNAFGLRFPSALAMLLLVMVAFEWLRKRQSPGLAFLFAASLLTIKGVLGPHTGRTGDMDAFLILFSFLMVISAWEFLHSRQGKWLIWAAIFFVFAFYSKGTAVFLLLPGLGLTFLYHERNFKFMGSKHFIAAVLVLLAGVFSWLLLIKMLGATYNSPVHDGKNAWEVMWGYETFGRLTSYHQEAIETHSDWDFLFVALDVYVGIWFIASVALIILQLALKSFRKQFLARTNFTGLQILIFALPAMLIVHFSANRFGWYIAPLTPFILLLPLGAVIRLHAKWRFSWLIYLLLFVVSLGIQVNGFVKIKGSELRGPNDAHNFAQTNQALLQSLEQPIVINESGHVLYLECKWVAPKTTIRFLGELTDSPMAGSSIIGKKGQFEVLEAKTELLFSTEGFEIRQYK